MGPSTGSGSDAPTTISLWISWIACDSAQYADDVLRDILIRQCPDSIGEYLLGHRYVDVNDPAYHCANLVERAGTIRILAIGQSA